MTALLPTPDQIIHEGKSIRVLRAWPHRDGVALELRSPDGEIRAGIRGLDGEVLIFPARTDPALPELGTHPGRLISHRAGRRAVIAADGFFIKVVRRGRAAAIVTAADHAAPFCAGYLVPEHHALSDSAVRISALPALPLIAAASSAERWRDAWTLWARADALVAHADVQSPSSSSPRRERPPLAEHGVGDEIRVLEDWATHIRRLHPDGADLVAQIGGESIVDALREHSRADGAAVLSHRDLHDGQILLGQDGIGLIDFDTVCRAPAGLDLGNLLAHLTLRQLEGQLTPAQHRIAAGRIGERAEARGVPPERLAEWERASYARLGLVYAVRPGAADLAAQLRTCAREGNRE